MSLYDTLSQIAERVKIQQAKMTSEEATKQVSIRPFINALGFNTHNLDEVYPEFQADAKTGGKEKVDFAILRDGRPIILVEAKAAFVELGDDHWKQLYNYFNSKREVLVGILTNGIKYLFYSDLDTPNIMDKKPFLVLDMLDLERRSVEVLEGFTKRRFDPLASIRFLQLRERVERELSVPSDWLVKHFIWGIHAGVKTKKVVNSYRPLLKQAIDVYVEREVEARLAQRESNANDPPKPVKEVPSEKTRPRAEFIPAFGYYNGHRFEAELKLESVRKGIFLGSKSIRYKGNLMKASHAMWVAIRDVFPEFDSDIWNSRKMNSWTFWHVTDPLDGSERILRHIAGMKHLRDNDLYERILNS